MHYTLDEYGNLINDYGYSKSIFDIAGKSRTLNYSANTLFMLSESRLFREENHPEYAYFEAFENWVKNGEEKIEAWKADGNKKIDDWENKGNMKMEDWKRRIEMFSAAFFTLPTSPVLPVPPSFSIAPLVPVNCSMEKFRWQKEKINRAWRERKDETMLSWKKRIDEIKNTWRTEKNRVRNAQTGGMSCQTR